MAAGSVLQNRQLEWRWLASLSPPRGYGSDGRSLTFCREQQRGTAGSTSGVRLAVPDARHAAHESVDQVNQYRLIESISTMPTPPPRRGPRAADEADEPADRPCERA